MNLYVVFASEDRSHRHAGYVLDSPRPVAPIRSFDRDGGLITTQEWWMYGRVLPEARRIAEITSLLAAARAEVGQLLETLGYSQATHLRYPATGELRFAQSFAGDSGWAVAHREEAISALRMAAQDAPAILVQTARIAYHLGDGTAAALIRRVLKRVAERLDEIRQLSHGF